MILKKRTTQVNEMTATMSVLLDLFKRVVGELDGGLHYTAYSKAMIGSLNKSDEYYPDDKKINITFENESVLWLPIDIICKGVYVVVSSNNMLVEKDFRNAKRILKYDRECKAVLLLNVDWYGEITDELFTRDQI